MMKMQDVAESLWRPATGALARSRSGRPRPSTPIPPTWSQRRRLSMVTAERDSFFRDRRALSIGAGSGCRCLSAEQFGNQGTLGQDMVRAVEPVGQRLGEIDAE